MLAIAMVSTLATATTTASATDTQTRGTIYFDSTDLYGATSNGRKPVYCYAWSNTDGALYSWTSTYTKMTNVGEHLYSYDVPSVNSNGQPIDANLMIFYADGGAQSWEVTFSDECIGDTAYISESIYEGGPADTYYGIPICRWKNNYQEGPHLVVGSTGKITGCILLDNETPESVADAFIEDYKIKMEEGYTGYDNPDMVTDEYRAELIHRIEMARFEDPNPTELPDESESISFNIPDSWALYHNAYDVHLWKISPNDENPYEWESRTDRMILDQETRKLARYKLPEGDWNMMSISSISGKQTLSSVIGQEYTGYSFTVKENNYGIESINDYYEIVWDVHPEYPNDKNYCSTHREIVLGSSIGIIGEAYVQDETDDTIFNNFRNEYGRKADGSCLWDETKKEIYNMSWEEAEKYVAKLLSVEYLLDGFDYAEEYGLKKGLPVVEGMEIPKRYSKDFVGADKVPDYWDGYYNIYYFDAPESWLTENADKKLDGYEIGIHWRGHTKDIYNKAKPGVPAKKLSKLDENGNDIYADSNIYYAFVPTFAEYIEWNNAIDTSVENYDEYVKNVYAYDLPIYPSHSLPEYSYKFGYVNLAGTLMYRPSEISESGELIEYVQPGFKFFDPQTGETTTAPLQNEFGQFVTRYFQEDYFGIRFYYTKATMNPYYDMDYAYTFQNVVDDPTDDPIDGPTDNPTDDPTDGPTDNPVEKPTVAPTEKPTTAPTQAPTTAPTNAPSSNTSNGTVNTAQSSAVKVLVSTLLASFGVVYAIGKKREKNS